MSRAKRIDRYQIGYARLRHAREFLEGHRHLLDYYDTNKVIRDIKEAQEVLQDATDREYRKAGNKYYPR